MDPIISDLLFSFSCGGIAGIVCFSAIHILRRPPRGKHPTPFQRFTPRQLEQYHREFARWGVYLTMQWRPDLLMEAHDLRRLAVRELRGIPAPAPHAESEAPEVIIYHSPEEMAERGRWTDHVVEERLPLPRETYRKGGRMIVKPRQAGRRYVASDLPLNRASGVFYLDDKTV